MLRTSSWWVTSRPCPSQKASGTILSVSGVLLRCKKPSATRVPSLPKGTASASAPVPGAVQSVIDITFPVYLKPGHPDVVAVSVMNTMLGVDSLAAVSTRTCARTRRTRTVRAAQCQPRQARGPLQRPRQCTQRGHRQLTWLSSSPKSAPWWETPAPDSTLQFVKNYLNGSFALSLERPETIARFALEHRALRIS